jgi:hypothetical protein
VDFTPVPLSLGRDVGVLHSQIYYAEVLLGVRDKVHRPLFDAIHKENRPLSTPEELEQFVAAKAGLSTSAVEDALESFMIGSYVQRAEQLAHRYGVVSTPTIVVGGQYRVKMAAFEKQLKVVDALIDKIRRERGAAKPTPAPTTEAAAATTAKPDLGESKHTETRPEAGAAVGTPSAQGQGSNGHAWLAVLGVALLLILGRWAVRSR